MRENKTSKENLDKKAYELADEQLKSVAGGVGMPRHEECLNCRFYVEGRGCIRRLCPYNMF